jgi:hypothetical protein
MAVCITSVCCPNPSRAKVTFVRNKLHESNFRAICGSFISPFRYRSSGILVNLSLKKPIFVERDGLNWDFKIKHALTLQIRMP